MKKITAILLVMLLAMPCLSVAESAGTVLERGEMFEAVFPIRGDMPGAKMLRVSVLCDPAAFEVQIPGEMDSAGRITYLVHLEDGAARGLWLRVLPDAVPGGYRISLTVHTVLGENAALQAVGVTAAPLQVTVSASLAAQGSAPADTPLMGQIGKLNAALDAGRQSRQELTQHLLEAQAEAAQAREELAGAQEDLAVMTANYTLAKEEATAVKDKLETAHKRLSVLISKIRAAQEIALRLSDELANTRKELYFSKAQLDTEIKKNEALAARVEELEALLKVKTQEVKEKDDQIVHLTADLENTQKDLYLTRETLEQMKTQLAQAREDLKAAQETIRQKENEIEGLQAGLAELTKNFEALKAENESLRDQLASVQGSLTELSNALAEEKRKNRDLTEENAALKKENDDLKTKNAALNEENENLRNEIARLIAELNEKTIVCDDLQKELEESNQKLDETKAALQEAVEQVQTLTEEKKEIAYQKAEALFKDRDFVAARAIYVTIPGYRDADEKAAACDEAIAAWNARLTVGQYVTLGRYPQSAAGKDRTPIEWLVLEVKGDKALLVSRRGLDAMAYNTVNGVYDWSSCSLRKWLNRDFINTAFTDDEKRVIVPTVIVSTLEKYTEGYAFSVNTTKDQVFLLSYAEVSKYLSVLAAESGSARYSVPLTDYAARRGGNTNGILGGKTGWWWLRLPGDNRSVSAVAMGSTANATPVYYMSINNPAGIVRPAIWVTLKDGALRP